MPHESKSIIVTVDDDAVNDMDGVVKRLTEQGMKVDRVLRATGVITGSAPSLQSLSKVHGVRSVEEEAVAKLPPRSSETPQ